MTDAPPLRGNIVTPSGIVAGELLVERGVISGIVPDATLDAGSAPYIVPGFIDLQVNGAFGVDAADGPEAIVRMARELPRTGVTTFLPTLISSTAEATRAVCRSLAIARSAATGADPLGLHLEGPWLSPHRPGAHPASAIEAASWELLRDVISSSALRMITLAPERAGALDAIGIARQAGITVSLGHSEATYEEVVAATDAGASMVTHLYNAMSPLHHRAPGVVGAALDDARLVVGLIADGVHVHPAAVRVAVRCKGIGGIVLVTDAVAAAGIGPGTFTLGGVEVESDGATARLRNGTLAGSVLTMDRALRNMVLWQTAPLAEVLLMTSSTPAAVLGLRDRGRIDPGLRADLVVLDRALQVRATMVAGDWVFAAS